MNLTVILHYFKCFLETWNFNGYNQVLSQEYLIINYVRLLFLINIVSKNRPKINFIENSARRNKYIPKSSGISMLTLPACYMVLFYQTGRCIQLVI